MISSIPATSILSSSLQVQESGKIRKEVLVVDTGQGELASLFPRLRELSFSIAHLDEPDWIPRIVRGSPSFAMVAINANIATPTQQQKIIDALYERDSEVPVLWLDDRSDPDLNFAASQDITRVVSPSSPQEISTQVYNLLQRRFFPKFITRIFAESVTEAMKNSFATDVKKVSTYMRADSVALGPISAMVTFAGDGCDGCVTISGQPSFFRASHRRLLPGLEAPKVAGIAGEICNVITGRFKAALLKYGLNLRHSFPIVVEAHPLSLSYGGPGRLGLVETLTDGEGAVSVELCLDILDTSRADTVEIPESLAMGELNFF